jgi:hypothetical protein
MNDIKDIESLGMRRASSKQLGNYYLCADATTCSAYKIVSYENGNPKTIQAVGHTRNTGDMTWDDVYDAIVGKPQGEPDFTEAIQ